MTNNENFQPMYYDNTRVSCHRQCPRRYYFRHIRHWCPEGENAALAFGLAWHSAQNIIWANITIPERTLIEAAYASFEETWTERGFPSQEDMSPQMAEKLGARIPQTAYEMICDYISARRSYIEDSEILAIEEPFAVPLDPSRADLFYVGRLDKRVKHGGKNYVIEHKTTSLYKVGGPFQWTFTEGFSPNSQCDGYLFSAKLMMHPEKVKSVLVDAALVHKNVHDGFRFIPVERREEDLDAWIWETVERIREMQLDQERLTLSKHMPEQRFLKAYPKNTESCLGKYGACAYLDLCKTISNPETIEDPPEGFKIEPWQPFSELHLDKLGLADELPPD